MLLTIIYLISGIIGGFCSSAPIGPINLWVADATLKNQESKIAPFLLGVILCDITYAGLASWGYYQWLQDGLWYTTFSLLGGGFLIALGFLGILQKSQVSYEKLTDSAIPPKGIANLSKFAMGIAMTGSNPGFLMFWVVAIDFLNQQANGSPDTLQFIAFLIGIILGDTVWFTLLQKLVRRSQNALKESGLILFRRIISCAFILLGATAIIRNL